MTNLSPSARALLDALPAHGVATVKRAGHAAGLADRDARAAVKELQAAGCVVRVESGGRGPVQLTRRGVEVQGVPGPDSVRFALRLIEVLPAGERRISLLVAAQHAGISVKAAAGAAAWLQRGRLVGWTHSSRGAPRLRLRPAGVAAKRELAGERATGTARGRA